MSGDLWSGYFRLFQVRTRLSQLVRLGHVNSGYIRLSVNIKLIQVRPG
jgi:hypothetical protein